MNNIVVSIKMCHCLYKRAASRRGQAHATTDQTQQKTNLCGSLKIKAAAKIGRHGKPLVPSRFFYAAALSAFCAAVYVLLFSMFVPFSFL